MNTILAINLIASNPAIRSGRPHIAGTTLTVADIAVAKVFWMMDADAIADHYALTLPQVYAALAYYYDHKDEIDASIRERRKLAAAMKEQRIGSRHPPLYAEFETEDRILAETGLSAYADGLRKEDDSA